jgi:quercetin dioxygenase-like cupin family protein
LKATKADRFSGSQELDHTPYKGGSKEFEGEVTLLRLVASGDSDEVELLAVWFSEGARTRPHVHDKDQVLLIVEGRGIVADDQERRVVTPGEVITVPAHTWHWHGATPHSSMMHISIRKQGCTTNWDVAQRDWASVNDG